MESGDFTETMANFPCMFNLPYLARVSSYRLKNRRETLEREIVEEEAEENGDEMKNKIRNSLTWLYFQLGQFQLAEETNESVLVDTDCIVALGNRIYMNRLRNGQVLDHIRRLNGLKEESTFTEKVVQAKSQQAFLLNSLGGVQNSISAVTLYEECLASTDNGDWRLGLGMAYRHLARFRGIFMHNLTTQECSVKAKECFEKAAESPDYNLKALAFANLAYNFGTAPRDIERLVDKAVEAAPQNSEVLSLCGSSLYKEGRYTERDEIVMKALDLLQRALALRPQSSVTHTNLGQAYHYLLKATKRVNKIPLQRSEIQEKAAEHFWKACETSNNSFLGYLYNLAQVYQSMNKHDEARKAIKTLFSSSIVKLNGLHKVLGCHKLLNYIEEHDEMQRRHGILATLASIAITKTNSSAEKLEAVWKKHFEEPYVRGDTSLDENSQMLYDYLEKQRHKSLESVFKVISRCLGNNQINDTDYLSSEVKEMSMVPGASGEALLFLELVFLRPRNVISRDLQNIYQQVLIDEALRCLDDGYCISSLFFQQAFNVSFSRVGGPPMEDSVGELAVKIDLLVLFNDCKERGDNLSSRTAFGLEDAISSLFNLNMNFNPFLLKEGANGNEQEAVLGFLSKHRVDKIVIVFEGDGGDTSTLLEQIQPALEQNPTEDGASSQPELLLVQCSDQPRENLPEQLRLVPCLTLGDPNSLFPNRFGLHEAQQQSEKNQNIPGILEAYFHGKKDNVRKLFDYLIRQQTDQ